EYSALNSWIPGGTIGSFTWANTGQTLVVDINKFVLVRSPVSVSILEPVIAAVASSALVFNPPGVASSGLIIGFYAFCLTLKGMRLPTSGAGNPQAVSVTSCQIGSFPVVSAGSGVLIESHPLIAVTQFGPQGNVVVTGHAPAE